MPVPGEVQPTATTATPVSFNDLLASALPSDADQGRLLTPPSDPWVYAHNPEAWEVGDINGVAHLLPVLTKFRLTPGMNHVGTRKQGAEPTAHLVLCFQDMVGKGLTVIAPGTEVPAALRPQLPSYATVRGYIAEYQARHPVTSIQGTLHQELWEVPVWTPPKAQQRFSFDRDLYNAWRLHLVTSRQVQPCPPSSAKALLDRARARHMRRLGVAYTADVRPLKLDESQREIERAESAIKPKANESQREIERAESAIKPKASAKAKAEAAA